MNSNPPLPSVVALRWLRSSRLVRVSWAPATRALTRILHDANDAAKSRLAGSPRHGQQDCNQEYRYLAQHVSSPPIPLRTIQVRAAMSGKYRDVRKEVVSDFIKELIA